MITIYSMNGCSWCVKAKEIAESYSLEYQVKDVGDTQTLTELQRLVPAVRTVPQIFWDDRHIGGYNEFAEEVQNTIGGYGESPC